jgi:outer membrane protein assembly factor BamD (BamD/ComL family)
MNLTVILIALLLTSLLGCSDKDAQELYMTAQFEERQKNVQHAKDLYQELTTKYPTSSYAKDAHARLTILNQDKPKQE